MEIFKESELELGKIYFISYGSNTQVVGRLKEITSTAYIFYDLLHYWNGHETFRQNDHCVKSGVELIRRASKPEKHHLVKTEIDNDAI